MTMKTVGPGRHLFAMVPDGFLTRDDLIFLYDKCAELIHARNPFVHEVKIEADFRKRSNRAWCRSARTTKRHT